MERAKVKNRYSIRVCKYSNYQHQKGETMNPKNQPSKVKKLTRIFSLANLVLMTFWIPANLPVQAAAEGGGNKSLEQEYQALEKKYNDLEKQYNDLPTKQDLENWKTDYTNNFYWFQTGMTIVMIIISLLALVVTGLLLDFLYKNYKNRNLDTSINELKNEIENELKNEIENELKNEIDGQKKLISDQEQKYTNYVKGLRNQMIKQNDSQKELISEQDQKYTTISADVENLKTQLSEQNENYGGIEKLIQDSINNSTEHITNLVKKRVGTEIPSNTDDVINTIKYQVIEVVRNEIYDDVLKSAKEALGIKDEDSDILVILQEDEIDEFLTNSKGWIKSIKEAYNRFKNTDNETLENKSFEVEKVKENQEAFAKRYKGESDDLILQTEIKEVGILWAIKSEDNDKYWFIVPRFKGNLEESNYKTLKTIFKDCPQSLASYDIKKFELIEPGLLEKLHDTEGDINQFKLIRKGKLKMENAE